MLYNNKSALKTPIINKVVYLNKQLAYYGRLLPHGRNRKNAAGEEQMTVDIRRCYFYPLLEKAGTLFTYAMRQLKGKDYLKRSIEMIEEIQAQCYLIMQMVLDSDYKQWLYFENRKGRLICEVKNEYKPKNIRIKELHEIREHQKLYEYEYRSKSKCSTKQCAA